MPRNRIWISFAAVLVVGAGLLILGQPWNRNSEEVFKFGYQPFGSNLPFFVAVDEKIFEKHGVLVEPIRILSANDAASAVVRGDLVGNATVPLNVLLNIEAVDPGRLKIFMIKATSAQLGWSDYLLVKKASTYRSLQDLEGLRVGGYPGSAQQSLIRLVFGKIAVEPVELAPSVQLQALETKQVDALLTYDELAALALENGIADVLVENPLSKYVVDPLYGFAYVLSTDFVTRHPREARAVIAAMYEAADFIRENPDTARGIMARWGGVSEAIAKRVNLWAQVPAAEVDRAAVQRLADMFASKGVVQRKIDVNPLFLSEADF